MPLPSDLLRRDAEEAVRLIALHLLSQAREAVPRTLDPKDEEGLHDFRVAIRRLRSSLSAWKALLRGVVGKRDRRPLAGFQKRTGASRDAEVALEWLEEQADLLAPEHRLGCEWVRARLRSASRARSGDENRAVCGEFTEWADGFASRIARWAPAWATGRADAEARLDRSAGQIGAGQDTDAGATYAEALAERLDRVARKLAECVDSLGGDRKTGPHRVRIAGKRLRYLVEPVAAESGMADSLVARCKRLQDVLGALNDANVLDDLMNVCLAEARTAGESGVVELVRLNAVRAEASYRLFRRDWLEGEGMRALLDEAAALARQLRDADDLADRRPVRPRASG